MSHYTLFEVNCTIGTKIAKLLTAIAKCLLMPSHARISKENVNMCILQDGEKKIVISQELTQLPNLPNVTQKYGIYQYITGCHTTIDNSRVQRDILHVT